MTGDTFTTRPLTAAEKGEQDEQVWRAERIRARRDAEAAQAARAEWLARLHKTWRV